MQVLQHAEIGFVQILRLQGHGEMWRVDACLLELRITASIGGGAANLVIFMLGNVQSIG